MVKRHCVTFVAGVVATLGYLAHLGPDFLIGTGVRWQAAQREYIVYSEPARELDESMVSDILDAKPAKAPKKVARR